MLQSFIVVSFFDVVRRQGVNPKPTNLRPGAQPVRSIFGAADYIPHRCRVESLLHPTLHLDLALQGSKIDTDRPENEYIQLVGPTEEH